MKISDRGIFALAKHEGIVPAPYLDSVGVWTYGIGHTAAAGPPAPQTLPRGMPSDLDTALRDVFAVFRRDLAKYEEAVLDVLDGRQVLQHEFDAAVSFHFNTGAIARASWVKEWLARRKQSAATLMMQWRKPAAIISRREAEQKLFSDAVYPAGRVAVWKVNTAGRVIWEPIRSLSQAEVLALLHPPKPDIGNPISPEPLTLESLAARVAALEALHAKDA